MSRIGKIPVTIPEGVTVSINPSREVCIKGGKGELTFRHHRDVSVVHNDAEKTLVVKPRMKSVRSIALWGTTTRILKNMVQGVTEGFTRKLELNGVGFRMNVSGKKLDLALGFSHPVNMEIPEEIQVAVEGNVLTISGIDKQVVGQFAANVRSLKPVEPYKGKGFRYDDEIVRRKEGKKAGA